MNRRDTFNMRFSPEERARLDALAQHYGVPGANVVRMLLKERFDDFVRDGIVVEQTKKRAR
jgi:predicted DNA-binding protein